MERSFSLSNRYLLGVHLIVPFALVMAIADRWFYSGWLLSNLPYSPEDLRWFTVFFHLPHIMASLFIFFDREYLSLYQKRLGLGIPLIAIGTYILVRVFGATALFIVFLVTTAHHVLMQQIGITRGFLRQGGIHFTIWKGCWLVTGNAIYLFLFIPHAWIPAGVEELSIFLMTLLLLPSTYSAFHLARQSASREGVSYLWVTHLTWCSLIGFFAFGYPFFIILIGRVIHDLTAFGYYVVHNYNRNWDQPRNLIFRLIPSSNRIFFLVLTPLAAMLAAYPLWDMRDVSSWTGVVVASVIFFHYYTEAFSWRKGAVHRAYVRIS